MSPDDPTPDDPLPVLKAEVDQAIASAPELARYAFGVFRAFCDQGFTEYQALRLTMNQLQRIGGQADPE